MIIQETTFATFLQQSTLMGGSNSLKPQGNPGPVGTCYTRACGYVAVMCVMNFITFHLESLSVPVFIPNNKPAVSNARSSL